MAEQETPKNFSSSKASLMTFGTRIVLIPLKVLVLVFVAKALKDKGFGTYSFLVMFIDLFLPLLFFGMTGWITYAISSKEYDAKDVTCLSIFICTFHGVLCSALVFFLWKLQMLGATGESITWAILLPVLIAIPLKGAAFGCLRVLIGIEAFTAMNIFTFIEMGLLPILLFVFVVALQMSLLGASYAILLTIIVLTLWSLYQTIKETRPRFAWSNSYLKEGYRFGARIWIGHAANTTNKRTDQFLLGLVSEKWLGIYALASRVVELITIIPEGAGPVLFTKVAAEKDDLVRVSIVQQVNRFLLFIGIVAGIAIIPVAWVGIPLIFDTGFWEARPVMLILIPGIVAYLTPKVLSRYFIGSNRPFIMSKIEIVGSISTTLLCYILIERYGIYGAAWGSTIGYFLTLLASVWYFRKAAGITDSKLFNISKNDIKWGYDQIKGGLINWKSHKV